MHNSYSIPEILYRGDADMNNVRHLKSTIDNFQFQTNLLNGGEGRKIFETPLLQLISKHIDMTWNQTHFLSFTEDLLTAYKYGSGNLNLTLEEFETDFIPFYDNGNDWNFGLLTLVCNKVNWKELDTGVFEGFFPTSLTKFTKDYTHYRIILIDVSTALVRSTCMDYKSAIESSIRDKEWLLLPATINYFNFNQLEYSGILDGGHCIYFKKFKLFK